MRRSERVECAKKIPISSYHSTKELVIKNCYILRRGVVGVSMLKEGRRLERDLFSLLCKECNGSTCASKYSFSFMNYKLLSSGGGGVHQANQP